MPSKNKTKYLVFSGGGAAFPAFAGAVSQLHKEPAFSFNDLQAVLGTSVGALAALLVALKYSPEEITEKLSTLDLSKMNDEFDLGRLFKTYGIFRQNKLYKLIKQFIKEKTKRKDPENVTFNDLKALGFLDLYIVTTKFYLLNGKPVGKQVVFSPEKYADTSVATAVLTSAAASPYFQARRLKKISKTKYQLRHKTDLDADFFTDGGLCDNYAITFFDKSKYIENMPDKLTETYNTQTLGLALITKQQMIDAEYHPTKEHLPESDIKQFSEAFINTLLIRFQYEHLNEPGTGARTIEIDRLDVQSFDFNIDKNKIDELIESGKAAVKHYFATDTHDLPATLPNLDDDDENDELQRVKSQPCKKCVIL